VPRARLQDEAGEREWKSALLPAYKRLSRRAEALIAEAYLAGMNTRRVRRALAKLFEGHVGKDMVSRAWQRTRAAWQAWQRRDLAGDDIVRLILDGTVVKVRLDRKATAISLLIALGVRRDGQKVVLAIKNMGGESEAAWRAVLDDLTARGLAKPDLASSWMAARASKRPWRACGTTSRCSAVPCTRSAICSPMRRSTCTTRSRPTSTT
jgi:transposase-like protein